MAFLSALRNPRPRVSRSLTPLLASVAPLLPTVAPAPLAAPLASSAFKVRPHVDPPWQDEVLTLKGSFVLENGVVLEQPKVACRLTGATGAPVIAVLGGISASRLAWQPESAGVQGWWQTLIGPGRALDTQQYRILTFDFLGGNGASESPRNSVRAGADFPAISSRDQAHALAALLDALEIPQLESAIGSSYGGMVALALGEQFPERVKRLLVVCAAHEAWPLATGWRHVQREFVKFGLKHNDVETGLKLARALAMTTYRSGQEFAERFEPGFAEGAPSTCATYLEHCGAKFSQVFDPYAFLCLSRSIDTHQVDPAGIPVPVDLLGFVSDQLVPPVQLEALQRALPQSRLTLSDSIYGHDAFLLEDPLMQSQIKNHLECCS